MKNSPASYRRKVLFGSEAFEVVACEWQRGSVSALHEHGWSQCYILVQQGCFENRAEFGAKSELAIYEPGQVIQTPVGARHEIRCVSENGSTLHVYVPKIKALAGRENFKPAPFSEIYQKCNLALSADPLPWREVEKLLAEIGNHSVSTHSPYFMNQLFSGVFPETLAAQQIISQFRTTMATYEASPAFTSVEVEVVDQLGKLIGWPSSEGIGVPGGSSANVMALHCARQKKVPEFRRRGSAGEKFAVFCSAEAHYSLKKACLATGIGTDALVEIATDSEGKIIASELRARIQASRSSGAIPLLVCATAGTTVKGAFDPIVEMAEICLAEDIWLHVDAAWGGPALFSAKAKHLLEGIERAQSVTFDAHKLFGAGLTTSFFLTSEKDILRAANDVSDGGYIFHSEEIGQDRGRLSWQCGRGADALAFWTLWKNLGTTGLGAFVDRLFSLREETLRWIAAQPRLHLVSRPSYLNLCVRVLPPPGAVEDPRWSQTIRERMKEENFAMVNFSRDSSGSFLRLILANPNLTLQHIQEILTRALEHQ